MEVVFIHRPQLEAVEGGDVGEIVFEMGLDLVVFQREFCKFFADVELRENARDDDIRVDAVNWGLFPETV